MVLRRHYPAIWTDRDVEELWDEFLTRFDRLVTNPALPTGSFSERIMPVLLGEMRVDIAEHADEVIVVADLPGVDKEDVELRLLNPRTLEIRCSRKKEVEDKKEGYYLKERRSGSMTRVVPLPDDVTDKDATATFRNGVLEAHFRKAKAEQSSRIQIQ